MVSNAVCVCMPCVRIVREEMSANSRCGFESPSVILLNSPSLSLNSLSVACSTKMSEGERISNGVSFAGHILETHYQPAVVRYL